MARVLLIDDDTALLDVLALAFEDAQHEVITAGDGAEGLAKVESQRPHAIVSDVNMPGIDGFSLCKRLREQGNATPLVLLTSRDGEIDEALGLELGADDYVSKPFSTRVLLARVAALLRRDMLRSGGSGFGATQTAGRLHLDAERLEVRYDDHTLVTTVTEFRLLEALTSRPGVVFSRPTLLDRIRGDDSVVAERIIDTYVRRLRRKLENLDATFDSIETVVGAGYRWKGPR